MEITNGMIYDMLKEFKDATNQRFEQVDQRFERIDQRFERIDQRFEQIDQRFERIDQRFEQIDKHFGQVDERLKTLEMRTEMFAMVLNDFRNETNRRFERIEAQQAEDHRILMNLWEYRDNMKLSFTRTLLTVTGLVSGVVAIIVSFITGRAIFLKS